MAPIQVGHRHRCIKIAIEIVIFAIVFTIFTIVIVIFTIVSVIQHPTLSGLSLSRGFGLRSAHAYILVYDVSSPKVKLNAIPFQVSSE